MSVKHPVTVVVPVYRGLRQTKSCLESVLASELNGAEVLVINDASPEPEVAQYCKELGRKSLVTLIENPKNLGFVATVNKAMIAKQGCDIVLLNSDTMVAGDWLECLRGAAYSRPKVATVTPFSNNAEICSFPLFCQNNRLYENESVSLLQGAFSVANRHQTLELPTAVGFCMFIRRQCLDAIGLFDEEAFGRGYGEENDFCLRATAAGWLHLLCADCFVFHEGNVSFQQDKVELTGHAERVIRERYPDYFSDVARFIAEDPLLPLRERAVRQLAATGWRLSKLFDGYPDDHLEDHLFMQTTITPNAAQVLDQLLRSDEPALLFITHCWGGGVEQHVQTLVGLVDCHVVVMRGLGDGGIELGFYLKGGEQEIIRAGGFDKVGLPNWLAVLKTIRIGRVHLHHIHGWPSSLIELILGLDVPLDITLHDYYLVSPQYHLTENGPVCSDSSWPREQAAWQRRLLPLVKKAERVIAPSSQVKARVGDAFPGVNITFKPHPEYVEASGPVYKVVVLGALTEEKGLRQVESVAKLAAERAPQIAITLIGYPTHPTDAPIVITGDYAADELPRLLAQEKPDAIWFPAQVPETYSFTLSHAMASGLPIVASSLGALEDRLGAYPLAKLLAANSLPSEWLEALKLAVDYSETGSVVYADTRDAYRQWYLEPPLKQTAQASADTVAVLEQLQCFPAPASDPDRPIRSLFEFGIRTHHSGVLREVQRRLQFLDDTETEVAGMQAYRALNEELQQYRPLKEVVEGLKHELRQAAEDARSLEVGYEVKLNAAEETIQLYDQNLSLAKDGIVELQQQAEKAQAYINKLEEEFKLTVESKDTQINALNTRIDQIARSFSWRVTRPLRVLKRVVFKSADLAQILLKHSLRPASYYRLASLVRRGQWRSILARLGMEVQGRQVQQNAMDEADAQAQKKVEQFEAFAQAVPENEPLPPVVLVTSAEPVVSIVIPVYGEHGTTHQCLRSIATYPPKVPYEVVIADDCSPESAEEVLSEVDGVRFCRGEKNLGFVGNTNAGASMAKGEYLVLLNNDTIVCAGAFDRLLATFSEHRDVGLVGAKLLNADGSLQEAGGIIWRDGSGWNWGRGQSAADPRFNYVRDADYCSGAVLAIRTDVFAELGGFDEYYMPAYYEDTDLAFRIREKGLRVVYQPAAEVFHIEGVSHGRDENSGVKAHQVTNGKKFFERWKSVLASHSDNAVEPENEANRYSKGNVLVIEACMITPDQDSGSIRMLNLLKILRDEGYHVTFVADNLEYREKVVAELNALGIEVLYNDWAGSVRRVLRKRGPTLDAIFISRHYIASQYLALARAVAPKAKLIFDTVDLHFVREEREAELSGDQALKAQAAVTKRKELELIRNCDITLVVSEFEKQLLADIVPEARVEIVSNIHSHTPERPDYEQREGILFVGGFRHPPNIDAVQWYAKEVMPHVQRLLPGVVTTIIGSHMPDSIKALANENLQILGFVEDIEPELQGARVSIAPLRYGAGVKGKVNEAMNYGIPVVATACAVEGMHTVDGEDVLVAEQPEAFAEAIARVYQNAELWRRISAGGVRNLESHFSPDAARPAIRRTMS
ncbi:glycosyltransferase [Gilvimarinus algae]|uniref:Glycosyltransferase n=1 Tax=Gilvimarinus algae TaxID=3058037 RepID=A0ABT8THM5_9GAMM|nr:glycosyltransferase [Gilvimarinus sp. SDUM040014]MDO3383583.1 glycosyltransferase [Gilvimarinus sp. SDUM040014]